MMLTIVGWRTQGKLLELFEEADVPDGLVWYPGNEVVTAEELTLTLNVLGSDPMLVLAHADEEDLRELGEWLTEHAPSLNRVETAVISEGWNETAQTLKATVTWPKWPLAWIPVSSPGETCNRLAQVALRAKSSEPAEFAAVQAGRSRL